MESQVEKLAQMISQSHHRVIMTGAGMDTESNIPDFRSEQGWWRSIDPRTVAHINTLFENYDLFREFYTMRLKLLEDCQPHRGHFILAELEEKGLIQAIATQNVSRFHTLAGSKTVYELHGNIRTFRCNQCSHPAEPETFFAGEKCEDCGARELRPNVTLFGESLPAEAWNNTLDEMAKADLLIVIGTSLEVSPVNQIPRFVKGKTVYINDDGDDKGYNFDLIIQGKVKGILEQLTDVLV